MITRSMITRNVVHTGRFYVLEHIFYTAKRTGSSGPSDKPQYAIMTHLLCGSQYTAVRLP